MLRILGSNQQDLKLCIRVGLVSVGKGQQAFKITPVNLESGTPRTSLKRISAGVERRIAQNLNTYIYSYKKYQQKQLFL